MTRLEDKCYEIYNRKGITGGATSVINYIMEHRPDVPWHYCVPCDATQPFDPYTESCLVCGSAKGFLQDGKTAPSLIEDARREYQKVEDRRREKKLARYEAEREKVRDIIGFKYGREYLRRLFRRR